MKFQVFTPIIIGALLAGCSSGVNISKPSHVYVYQGERLDALDEAIVHASGVRHCEDEYSIDCEYSMAYQYSLRPSGMQNSSSRRVFHLKPGNHAFEVGYEEYMNVIQTDFSPGMRTYVPGGRLGSGYWTDGAGSFQTYTQRTGYKKKSFPAYLPLKAAHEYRVVVQNQHNDWKPQQVCVVEQPISRQAAENSAAPQTPPNTRRVYCRSAVGDYVGFESKSKTSGLGRYDKSRLEYVQD